MKENDRRGVIQEVVSFGSHVFGRLYGLAGISIWSLILGPVTGILGTSSQRSG